MEIFNIITICHTINLSDHENIWQMKCKKVNIFPTNKEYYQFQF